MNREITFRAWNNISCKMEFQDNYLVGDNDDRSSWCLIVMDDDCEYEIMQFTGLLDKNGKKIYEGDIVEWTIYPFEDYPPRQVRDVVYFSSGCFALKERKELLFNKVPNIEVIGNVFEDLLPRP